MAELGDGTRLTTPNSATSGNLTAAGCQVSTAEETSERPAAGFSEETLLACATLKSNFSSALVPPSRNGKRLAWSSVCKPPPGVVNEPNDMAPLPMLINIEVASCCGSKYVARFDANADGPASTSKARPISLPAAPQRGIDDVPETRLPANDMVPSATGRCDSASHCITAGGDAAGTSPRITSRRPSSRELTEPTPATDDIELIATSSFVAIGSCSGTNLTWRLAGSRSSSKTGGNPAASMDDPNDPPRGADTGKRPKERRPSPAFSANRIDFRALHRTSLTSAVCQKRRDSSRSPICVPPATPSLTDLP